MCNKSQPPHLGNLLHGGFTLSLDGSNTSRSVVKISCLFTYVTLTLTFSPFNAYGTKIVNPFGIWDIPSPSIPYESMYSSRKSPCLYSAINLSSLRISYSGHE